MAVKDAVSGTRWQWSREVAVARQLTTAIRLPPADTGQRECSRASTGAASCNASLFHSWNKDLHVFSLTRRARPGGCRGPAKHGRHRIQDLTKQYPCRGRRDGRKSSPRGGRARVAQRANQAQLRLAGGCRESPAADRRRGVAPHRRQRVWPRLRGPRPATVRDAARCARR